MNVFMVTCGVGEYFLTELNELLLPRVIGKNSFMNYCYKLQGDRHPMQRYIVCARELK